MHGVPAREGADVTSLKEKAFFGGLADSLSDDMGSLLRRADAWLRRRPKDADIADIEARTPDNDRLMQMIEGEVIPRLMLAHRAVDAMRGPRDFSDVEIDAFAHLVMKHDLDVILCYMEALRVQGVSTESLFIDLFGPTARRLGVFWEQDECDFSDVTIALSRLHRVVLAVGGENHNIEQPVASRVYVASYPGDQHAFGASVIAQLFRNAGWSVVDGRPDTARQLLDDIPRGGYDLLCLSATTVRAPDDVARLIADVRRAAAPRDIAVMIGGRAFAEAPQMVDAVGADAYGQDALGAVAMARRCLDKRRAGR